VQQDVDDALVRAVDLRLVALREEVVGGLHAPGGGAGIGPILYE
jgi:hypothetical protein